MSDDKNLHLNINNSGNEVIFRQGEAAPVELPVKINFAGLIYSPAEFYTDRCIEKNLVPIEKSHVEVDRRNSTITLFVDERDPRGTVIKGSLILNPDLAAFGIWDKNFERSELQKFLKKNRRFFADKEQFNKISKSLADYKFTRITNGQEKDDRAGNTKQLRETKLEQNLDLSFKLNIPIFEREKSSVFLVEIIPDETDVNVSFHLESVELIELKEKLRDEIFATVIAIFKLEKHILILEK